MSKICEERHLFNGEKHRGGGSFQTLQTRESDGLLPGPVHPCFIPSGRGSGIYAMSYPLNLD